MVLGSQIGQRWKRQFRVSNETMMKHYNFLFVSVLMGEVYACCEAPVFWGSDRAFALRRPDDIRWSTFKGRKV